jgi:hypothetical protein
MYLGRKTVGNSNQIQQKGIADFLPLDICPLLFYLFIPPFFFFCFLEGIEIECFAGDTMPFFLTTAEIVSNHPYERKWFHSPY